MRDMEMTLDQQGYFLFANLIDRVVYVCLYPCFDGNILTRAQRECKMVTQAKAVFKKGCRRRNVASLKKLGTVNEGNNPVGREVKLRLSRRC